MSDAYNDAKRGNWLWGKKDKGTIEGDTLHDNIVDMEYDAEKEFKRWLTGKQYDVLLEYAIELRTDCEILLRKLREAFEEEK